MRKLLSLLTAILFVGSVWGADVNVSFTSWTQSQSTYSSDEWTDNGCTFTYAANNNKAFAYVRCGTKNVASGNSTIQYNSKVTIPVDSVVLALAGIANGNSSTITITGVEVAAYSDNNFSNLVSSENLGELNIVKANCPASLKIAPSTPWSKDLYYKITISWALTGSKNCGLNISGITFYEKIVKSSITITAPEHGAMSIVDGEDPITSGTLIKEGTELTVTATPDAVNHYIGGTITVKDGEDNDVTASVLSGSTLTMPDYAITVSADFTATYAINLIGNGGSIDLDYTAGGAEEGYAIAGTEIMATATADDAHTFNSLAVSANALDVVVDENVATFTMPAEAVSVTATFAEKSTPTISVDETALAFGIVNINTTPVPQSFHVSGVALSEGALTITSNNSAFTVSPASIDVNGTLDDTEITVTPVTTKAGNFNGKITISGGGAEAKEVALSLVVKDIYTITWHVCGEDDELTYVVEDNKIVPIADPTLDEKYETKTFMGWAESAIDGSSASATLVDFATFAAPTANDEFWAVFATADDIDEVVIEQSGTTEPKDFTVTVNAENKTDYYQDGSDNNFPGTRYVQVKVTEDTQLIPIEPETITLTANLGGGSAKADLANSVYAVLIDKDGNALGDPVMLTDAILSQKGDPFSKSMPTENYASVRGVKVTHDKDASYNVRYYGITLSYQVSLYSEYETTVPEKSATALDNTEVEGKAVKVLRNGVLYIEKNGVRYNAMGQVIK